MPVAAAAGAAPAALRGARRRTTGPSRAHREAPALLGGRALALTALAILLGGAGMLISTLLGHNATLEPATYLRYVLVITLGVYAGVAVLLVTQVLPAARLRWHRGDPVVGILLGAAVGGVLSGALLAIVSQTAGHLAPDPRVVTLMSEGDLPHIALTVVLTCVCAPLIEEVLFRGVLCESLSRRSARLGLGVSALAFAVWHLNPAALRYYALMGLLLGWLFQRRGLCCSIAAHVAFNGVLTAAALAVVLAPSHVLTGGPFSVTVPGGWSAARAGASGLAIAGPSGAELVLADLPTGRTVSLAEVTARIHDGAYDAGRSGVVVDTGSTRPVHLPAGDAVEVDVTARGHRGTMVFVPLDGHVVEAVFLSGGSVRAQADFPEMLRSLRVI